MGKEPNTIGELFFYMEGEFTRLGTEIENMKKFVYWVAGVTSVGVSTVLACIIKFIF